VTHLKESSLAVALVLASPAFNFAQQGDFEVATVKTSPPPQGNSININLGGFRNGVLTFTNASLSDCLKFAYNLVSDAQLSGPAWITSKEVRFDIVAQAAPDTPRDQLRPMLQALLAERLKLVAHFERSDLTYLALVQGKNGSKVRQAAPGLAQSNGISMRGHINGVAMPMPTLALLLSRFERETVINMTGLDGLYEVNLEWTPDESFPQPGGAIRPPEPPVGPALPTALQEQLGLKLEGRKGPLDVLVVDHAEKVPSEN
jgi:uncharacterized protein (TIGR03435 family)